jgi:A/G-specific adenine glycosylase
MNDLKFIGKQLIDWYAAHRRDLPWRNIHDPYRIWISEIILQQTRVAQGLDYYRRFIERFPDVRTLAAAEEQEVLKYWQGLGYYSRARNLHAAARTIAEEYGGEFPREHAQVLKLKGIGDYTAAAIVSFAWNQPYPVVDGNVFRVLSRLFAVDEPIDTGKGKKLFTSLAAELMPPDEAGVFNQAIMEFGALQCVPSSPACALCPLADSCLALAKKAVSDYPVKQNKTKTQDRYLYYFHIHDAEHLYLKRRVGSGIWQNLYEFPLIESETPLDFNQLSQTPQFREWFPPGEAYDFRLKIENRKHVLSHRVLYATFYEVSLPKLPAPPTGCIRVHRSEWEQYPVHRLMLHYLDC